MYSNFISAEDVSDRNIALVQFRQDYSQFLTTGTENPPDFARSAPLPLDFVLHMAHSAQRDSIKHALDDILSDGNAVKLFKKEREMFTAINDAYVRLTIFLSQPRWAWHLAHQEARVIYFHSLGPKAVILGSLQMVVYILCGPPNTDILRNVTVSLVLGGFCLDTVAVLVALAKTIFSSIPRARAIVFAVLDIFEDLERSLETFKSNLNNINRQGVLRDSTTCEDGEAHAFSGFLKALAEQHAKAQDSLNSINGHSNDSTLFHLSFYSGLFLFLLSLTLVIVILFLRFTAGVPLSTS